MPFVLCNMKAYVTVTKSTFIAVQEKSGKSLPSSIRCCTQSFLL